MNIFISYRRRETQIVTNAIAKRLVQEFGEKNVFKDVDSILPGTLWLAELRSELERCNVLLAVIGPSWLNPTAVDGRARQRDLVKFEVASALKRKITVIPILVGEACIPPKADLPRSLQGLDQYQGLEVRSDSDPDFENDMARLIFALKTIEAKTTTAPLAEAPAPERAASPKTVSAGPKKKQPEAPRQTVIAPVKETLSSVSGAASDEWKPSTGEDKLRTFIGGVIMVIILIVYRSFFNSGEPAKTGGVVPSHKPGTHPAPVPYDTNRPFVVSSPGLVPVPPPASHPLSVDEFNKFLKRQNR